MSMIGLAACSSSGEPRATETSKLCAPAAALEVGSAAGHPDPFGAKAAGQARASRIADASLVAQPAHGRQRVRTGDYLLLNGSIAIIIEDRGISDGYARFGGEILAVDQVGDDGKPRGVSQYVETLVGFSNEMVNPSSVSVLRDGSDGGEAIVRVVGKLETIPFLDGPLGQLFPNAYGFDVAYDYVLAPGAERVVVRVHIVNASLEPVDFGLETPGADELFGFFHGSRSQLVTPETGYAYPEPHSAWVGFDGGAWGFAWRVVDAPIEFTTEQSGFSMFLGPGFLADACSTTTADRFEIIAGGPGYDGLREAVRRSSGEAPWTAITGTLTDALGAPIAGAFVHELDAAGGAYLSRATTAADGSFEIHAPSGAVTLVPQKLGYPAHAGANIAAGATTAALAFAAHGTLHVVATDALTSEKLPVRVQVIPAAPDPETPEAYGVLDEVGGRLHQEFAMTGEATLIVPPGEHRVVVSRGYEWELLDTTVTVAAGATVEVAAPLEHSVDTTDVLCADFHIHSFFSADSSDPVDHKVRGAIADGLDIPVSSEHEWIVDFQPVIEQLGLTKWAFGVASEELTTFTWGHFGVVPLTPREDEVNAGAIEWIGKLPGEVFDDVHAHEEEPALIVNHPSGSGFGSYFSMAKLDTKTGVGQGELWSSHFDAVEVFNDSDFESNRKKSVADWFSLLNAGMTVWAVGSSDSHHLRTSPVGYPRTCMRFGHDDPTKLTGAAVRDAILSGDYTVSGGAFMTVEGPGGERPGSTIAASEATFTVTVEVPGWLDVDTLETIVDGQTIAVEPLLPLGVGPSKRFVNQVLVTADPSKPRSWVVFHAKGEGDLAPLHPGRRAFAASNPVFLAN